MTPRMPSEPMKRRSGPGPAPEPARLDHARGRNDAQRLHELVDVGVERRVVAAGAGRDPAAERRELERLREVAEREPVRPELLLERGAEYAGLDARRARGAIDLEHAVEAGEIQGDGAGVARADGRLYAAHDARAASVRDDRRVRSRAPLEHGRDLLFRLREGDQVGRVREVAAQRAHHVAEGLAVGVPGAV